MKVNPPALMIELNKEVRTCHYKNNTINNDMIISNNTMTTQMIINNMAFASIIPILFM